MGLDNFRHCGTFGIVLQQIIVLRVLPNHAKVLGVVFLSQVVVLKAEVVRAVAFRLGIIQSKAGRRSVH
jgi:hypothetical protein